MSAASLDAAEGRQRAGIRVDEGGLARRQRERPAAVAEVGRAVQPERESRGPAVGRACAHRTVKRGTADEGEQAAPGVGAGEVIQGRQRTAPHQGAEQVPGTGGGRGPRGDGAARAALRGEDRQSALREKQVRASAPTRRVRPGPPRIRDTPRNSWRTRRPCSPSRRSTFSRGGADSTQLKPPRHRVSPSRTRKTSGNSRSQWKNPCSPRSRSISARVSAGRVPSAPRSRRSSRTRLTIAGGASGVLAQAKAAHQASATRRFARKAAESRHLWYSAA